ASAQVCAVKGFDGGVTLGAIGHLYESKAAQAAAELIANEIHLANRSILSKSLSQVIFSRTEGEISNVDVQLANPSFRERCSCKTVVAGAQNQTQRERF